MTRTYNICGPALLHFLVEIWVENRPRPESVKAGAGQSGSMDPATRLLEQSFALKGGGTLETISESADTEPGSRR
jgi:hypothetical protein